ncbi:MAG: 3-oxoacyl-[acyl-carrier-protein] reductase [Nitrospiria bacterium]
MPEFDGKVALITGGAQGIGKAVGTLLAERGATVVVSDLNLEAAEQTVSEWTSRGLEAMAIRADVARVDDVKGMFDAVLSRYEKIDILVNNAGITRDTLLMRMKDEDWDLVLSVNLKGTFNCMKSALSAMSKKRFGRIVNISSIVGAIGNPGQANYAASKAAVIGLTKTVAREYASRGITVNAVAPGFIDTSMTESLSDNVKESLMKQIPQGRLGLPADVAHAVAFLASAGSDYITGQVLHVNGGMYMSG